MSLADFLVRATFQDHAPYRDRRLLDLAHKVTCCTNCRMWVEGCEPAHGNGVTMGKGIASKASDNLHAAICHECHAWLDQGGNGLDPSGRYQPTREDKRAMWTAAHFVTMTFYWRMGWLTVAR